MNFIDKKISVQETIETLEHQGIYVDNEEVNLIRDPLYLMAKNHKKIEGDENI